MNWPTLLVIDLMNGTRVALFCRTPISLRDSEEVLVFDSETGWKTGEKENSPIPPDHRLRLVGSGHIRGNWGHALEGVPWVVYVKSVPKGS